MIQKRRMSLQVNLAMEVYLMTPSCKIEQCISLAVKIIVGSIKIKRPNDARKPYWREDGNRRKKCVDSLDICCMFLKLPRLVNTLRWLLVVAVGAASSFAGNFDLPRNYDAIRRGVVSRNMWKFL